MQEQFPEKNIYTVSRLNTEVRQVLESSFPLLWVEGEISNLSTPRSGHMYFSLKDAHAQTRCAMFRMKRQLLRFMPGDGMQVLVRARITLYEARGDFQLVVEHMEPAGEGQLRQAVEQLKNRLAAEGLFDPAHKKDLPVLATVVGVVTSPTGAAITDILHVFNRRFPATKIIIYPVPVQGEDAAIKISDMLRLADQRNECDLFILARGGGSLEDLMAFNDEQLARTIFSLQTPIISAVGHEIDTSISDYVADRRAPTPSAAAELASPDQQHLLQQLDRLNQRLLHLTSAGLNAQQVKFSHLLQRLNLLSPSRQLQNRSQAIDYLDNRLVQQMDLTMHKHRQHFEQLCQRLNLNTPARQINSKQSQFNSLQQRLLVASPGKKIQRDFQQIALLDKQLVQSMQHNLERLREKLHASGRILDSVSPLATLSRGYSIIKDSRGKIIRHASDVETGQAVIAQLSEGQLHCRVESSEN